MSSTRGRKDFFGLVVWLGITFVAAGIGGLASVDSPQFYRNLVLPAWAPPPSVFGPVWTVLYAFMDIAAWLVWRTGGFGPARTALILYLSQLGINALWTWLFFGWRLGAASFLDILLLWALLAAALAAFWRIKPLAGALLVPYLLWVTYAAALNYAIWRLNPGVLALV